MAAAGVRATTAVQGSGAELVSAREEERRRLRRDLPDGLGPTLAGVTMGLHAASIRVRGDPAEAERLLGWTMEELNEKGAHDLIHFRREDGTKLPLEECEIHNVINKGTSFVSTEEVFVRKDGTTFPISVVSSPVFENGRAVASVTAFRDITERKALEQEREQLIIDHMEALSQIKTLSGMLPICASCKRIRDDKGYWNQIESYIQQHSEAEFSHGLCPECAKMIYPKYYTDKT